ncbi:MAG: cell filamentation protein Fic [Ignavibacteria bacterium GWF2_33_9]|nr:MAG: cell filamentation protein Fic [Ignavibacteria bacterium GWF2_33_9]
MNSVNISVKASVFRGKVIPEFGTIVGYTAIIHLYQLSLPIPSKIAIIINKEINRYENDEYLAFPPSYTPNDSIYEHLVFALKYEGINLLFFKKLFEQISEKEMISILSIEPKGQYSLKIWFLYEFLMNKILSIPNADTKLKFIPLVDAKQQYCLDGGVKSGRHRIINNLPGTVDFCPLIRKTKKIEAYILDDIPSKTNKLSESIHKDILLRTSAFLMLKDSKASFSIEGEKPSNSRAVRWGKAIGQAGSTTLTVEELLRLQQIIIDNNRFVSMGFRTEGGFVGVHDRNTSEPIPDHISAKWQDIEQLVNGLLSAYNLLKDNKFNPLLSAAAIAFGFVFIHPFEDGNGRLHRYLIHHILAETKFTPQGIVFPVSSAILERIIDYRKVLESFSSPLLEFINWEKTSKNNIQVLNDTIDFYRYFDATKQTEFLIECVEETINNIIPREAEYLLKYDKMKIWLDDEFQMPDKMIDLLINILTHNEGKLSKRKSDKMFAELTEKEVKKIETEFSNLFS